VSVSDQKKLSIAADVSLLIDTTRIIMQNAQTWSNQNQNDFKDENKYIPGQERTGLRK
jgi:hypothetical protein